MNPVENSLNKVSHKDPLYVPDKQEWAKMTESERQAKEDSIICALEHESSLMGETTIHFNARASASEVLRRFYNGQGKKVFIASDLHTLYPGERAFYPDLLVVFEVEDYHRRSWNVHREKKGLDFVLEIISKSSRRNDQVEKLNLFARLGIPEYFMFDPDKYTLSGFRLDTANEYQQYLPIQPDHSNYLSSSVLGLNLIIDNDKLRFVSPDGLEVLFSDELIHRLNNKLSDKDEIIARARQEKEQERQEKEQERQEKEQERKEKEIEKARADQLEKELAELKANLNN
ncbi:MAG: Uma2 family endonuclease [gamma proteobacterium symbiont of Taylorina sp.]|nr:Uma2 family endonuclease [gamma proteobacterium symbiont of Taylorina sp.]